MSTLKKTLFGLGGAAVLAVGLAAVSTAASASDCNSCIDWQKRLEASAQGQTGANLNFPGAGFATQMGSASQAGTGPTHCDAVLTQPSQYPWDEVSSCRASAH